MVNENINDKEKWTKFVKKLISDTKAEKITWDDVSEFTKRDRAFGPIFVSEIRPNNFVAVFRYSFDHYSDVDTYETVEDVAIELVDEHWVKLWRLPDVGPRYELIDLLEYISADAQSILDGYLNEK